MKKILYSSLLAGTVAFSAMSAQAQLFTPESVTGAAFGALAGGIIGHNTGSGHTAEGAGIGAGVGLLLGSIAHQDRVQSGYYSPGYSYGYGGYGRYGGSVYYAPRYRHGGYGYYGWHHPYAIGFSYAPAPVIVEAPPTVVTAPEAAPAPAPAPQPQQVTIINNYYNNSTPMSSANALFGR